MPIGKRTLGVVIGMSTLLGAAVSCVDVNGLRARASGDLSCPESGLEVTKLSAAVSAVEGCGRRATYIYSAGGWLMESIRDDSSSEAVRQPGSPRKESRTGGDIVHGSGFVVSADGHILTANHVVENVNSAWTQCGGGPVGQAEVIKRDKAHDLALLRSDHPTSSFLTVTPSAAVTLGEPVFTVGFPVRVILGSEAKFAEGAIGSLTGINDAPEVFQISVPIQPGNSGGPLVRADGTVVGVITSSASASAFFEVTGALPQGVNWAVKSDYALPWLQQDAPPANQAGGSRTEVIARVRSAVCFIATGKDAGTQFQGPPQGAAGFRFGMTAVDAKTTCATAGHTWTEAPGAGTCSEPPIEVGFQAPVEVTFCEDTVCKISLTWRPQTRESEKLETRFERLSALLTRRYGRPGDDDGFKSDCLGELVDCLDSGRVKLTRKWSWPSKPWVIETLGAVDGKAAIILQYIDTPAQGTPVKKRKKKKPERPIEPRGL